jgi:hypothetical protein
LSFELSDIRPRRARVEAVISLLAGDITEAHRTTETLANFNDPTVEQALVVPAFRKCYQDPTCNSNLKGVSLKKSFPKTF